MPLLPGAEPYSHDGGAVGVLVIHGFTGSPASVTPWGRRLAREGFTVRVPRLPGHGTRWQDLNLTTWQDWYAEAERVFLELSERCDHVFVMGLSMGGTLTLRLAEERAAQISGIVLVNPAVHSERPDRFALPLIRNLIPSFPGITDDIRRQGVSEHGYDRMPLKATYSLTQLWRLVKADIGRVTAPLLLLHSAEDHVVEPSNSAFVLANVSSTEVTEIVLHHSFHVATLDHDAATIEESSVDFVRRHASLPAS